MFLIPEEPFNPRNRPRRERVLKWVNQLVFIGSFLAFCVTVADVNQRATNTVDNFWLPSSFQLVNDLDAQLGNCTRTAMLRLGDWHAPFTIGPDTRDAVMAHTAALIRRSMWVTGAAVLLGGINRLLFDRGVHELPLLGGVVGVRKGYVLLLEVAAVVWSIVALKHPQEGSGFVADYVEECGGSGGEHLWGAPPFVPMFVAHGVVLTAYVATWVVFFSNAVGPDPPPLVRRQWRELLAVVAARSNTGDEGEVTTTSLQLVDLLKKQLSQQIEGEPISDPAPHEHIDYPPTPATGGGIPRYPPDPGEEARHYSATPVLMSYPSP